MLDVLGFGKAHVVGASMGGYIAQTMAIEHPDRVRSLTSMMSHRQPYPTACTTPMLRVGQILFHVASFEDFDVQEAKHTDVHDHRIDGKLPVFQKVRVVAPDVIRAELIERRVDVLPEMLNRFQDCTVNARYSSSGTMSRTPAGPPMNSAEPAAPGARSYSE